MISDDPNQLQQQQPIPAPTYPSRAASQVPPVPTTDKVPSVPAPTGLRSQPWPQPQPFRHPQSWPPTAQPGMPWAQPQLTAQPGMPQPQPQTVAPRQRKRSRVRTATIGALTFMLIVVFGVGLFSGWTFAHTPGAATNSPTTTSTANTAQSGNSLSSLEAAQEAAIAKVQPAVVQIQGTVSQGTALGSGVIIDQQGDIVTNNHVVDGVSSLTVTFSNGQTQTPQLIGTDPANDLAVLRIRPFANMVVATLGDSAQLAVGQEVLAIGNPLGYTGTVTSGVVSALNRSEAESRSLTLNNLIQTSAAINPGNSGGALINLQGQVVGIPTLSAIDSETNTPAEGIGFAISSNTVQTVVARILGK